MVVPKGLTQPESFRNAVETNRQSDRKHPFAVCCVSSSPTVPRTVQEAKACTPNTNPYASEDEPDDVEYQE